MSEQAQRVRAYRLFGEALELAEAERAAFLAAACAGDAPLRAEVDGLLASARHDPFATSALLGSPPRAEATPESQVGRSVGHFRLLERIGEGGMGVVYRAERTDGVTQAVAVKLVAGMLSASARRRFEREARLLARLEHPAIARLIDAGFEESQAWIALEFVRGERIDQYCATRQLPARQIVQLLVQLADAVSAAHAMLVVHSDIKPANVLVGGDGTPKLVDFGIATALREAEGDESATTSLARHFSPNYAAPEQLTGAAVTVATDVFGLGALAYRLLSGVAPYAEARSAVAYMRAISQRDVERASRAAQKAQRSAAEVRSLGGDLDAILGKALDRDPLRRYASATEFKADLQRYLEGHPVAARPATAGYRLGKFLRRNAVASALSAVLVLGLASAAVVVGLQMHRATVARAMAARRGEFLEKLLSSADPGQGRRDITVAELLDSASQNLDQQFGAEPLVEASMAGLIADSDAGLGRYAEAIAANERQLKLLDANGGSALDRARALIVRGGLQHSSGDFAQGQVALRQALQLLGQIRGSEIDRARALRELAGVLGNTGDEAQSEQLFRQAIALERRSPEGRQYLGGTLQGLAVLLGNEGRYADSAAAARESLEVQRALLPPDHPNLLEVEQTYAMTLLNLEEPAQAEPLLRDLVARSQRVRGPTHAVTLMAQVQLGEVLIDLKRYAEAASLLHSTADAFDQTMGPSYRYAASSWSDFALASCEGDDATAGLAASAHVASVRSQSLPANDWHNMATATVTGLCLMRLHRYAEAEPLLVKASSDLEASRGQRFYMTQLAYKTLRELYQQTHREAMAAQVAGKITS